MTVEGAFRLLERITATFPPAANTRHGLGIDKDGVLSITILFGGRWQDYRFDAADLTRPWDDVASDIEVMERARRASDLGTPGAVTP